MEGEEIRIRGGKMDKERRGEQHPAAHPSSLEMDEVGKKSQQATLKSHPKSRFKIYSWDRAPGA